MPSAVQKTALIADCSREFFTENFFGRFLALGLFYKLHQHVALQHFSSGSERICWEGSSNMVLLQKLEIALKDHQVKEAWVTFMDFKNLYGFPTVSMVSRLISQLSYSSDPHWLQKACDLVFLILKEKPALLQFQVLTKLSLSLARAQMPIPASMILRLMLEREHMPPLNILWSIVSHMVRTEIGTCVVSNFLVQMCNCFLRLTANRSVRAKVVKPDTMIFNLVLNACVRFKSSLKGQEILELMSRTGVIADAHSVIFIAQIHEMNGQRDEIEKFKDHVDRVSATFLGHYWQFYDSLLELHFKFDDIDSAAGLVLDMHNLQESIPNKKPRMDLEKPLLVPIGSDNLKTGLKIQIMPELLHKDSILKVEYDKPELVMFRSGKLLLSYRALAKLVNGYKRHRRVTELSKLLLTIQQDFHLLEGSSLYLDVIDACIHLGWLEMAHDILDDTEAAGAPLGNTTYMALLTAYYSREMFKEANALLRQMKKAALYINLSDDMVATARLSEAANNASSSSSKSNLIDFLVREIREEKAIPSMVYEINTSIYYFCKAKMMEDAMQAYRRMQYINIRTTDQTFAYLIDGYSSLEMYREITVLWGDIKRNMDSRNLEVSRGLYELLLLNFLRGGHFERTMEVIGYMKERNMYTDKWLYKDEFLKLHKNLYRRLKASEARTESQRKRLEYVKTFRKWAGID